LIDEDDSLLLNPKYDFQDEEYNPERDGILPIPPLASANYQQAHVVKQI
jgi:hypothetical protein